MTKSDTERMDKKITISLDQATLEKLNWMAAKNKVSLSMAVRKLITNHYGKDIFIFWDNPDDDYYDKKEATK
jgi:hypothetical protein